MTRHGGAGGGCRPPGPGATGGYWTELRNPDCDPVLRDFPGAVLLGEREPEEPHAPAVRVGPRMALADEALLDGYCDWFLELGINVMFSATFRPSVAEKLCRPTDSGKTILPRRYAHRLVVVELLTMGWTDGRRGFPWPFFVTSEETPSGRDVAHCHGGLRLPERADLQPMMLDHLSRHFLMRFGFCRFEVMLDQHKANKYGLKDCAKQVKRDPDAVFVRPYSPRRRALAR